MHTGKWSVTSALVTLGCASALAADTPFEATTRGTSCGSTSQGSLECKYKVGRDLEFSIAAVGQSDAGISFTRSSYTGDYYAPFGVQHGCVIIAYGQRGLKEARILSGTHSFHRAPVASTVCGPNAKVSDAWHLTAQSRGSTGKARVPRIVNVRGHSRA